MDPIVLKAGDYEAVFLPSKGLNLISFKKGAIEVIDQSTKKAFDERFSGLGALIGPHFHRRNPKTIPKIPHEELFPHIAFCKSKGILDPFSHGIARYAPWKVTHQEASLKGEISGKDLWNDVPLSILEGQNFIMKMDASLSSFGLTLGLSIVSDTDSLVGLHYYYRLPKGKNQVRFHDQVIDLDHAIDSTFHPSPHPLHGDIRLETEEYTLKTIYNCISQENSWQLFHPEGANYVCIEPISAQDPRHPNLSVSALTINLQIT